MGRSVAGAPLAHLQGRYWEAFQRGPIGRWCVGPDGFLPGRCVYHDEEALASSPQAVFAAFPHGVVSFHHALMATDADGFISRFPQHSCHRRRDLAASVTFLIPGWRELLLWMGCVDAGKRTARQVLKKGWSMYVLPGGEMEQVRGARPICSDAPPCPSPPTADNKPHAGRLPPLG